MWATLLCTRFLSIATACHEGLKKFLEWKMMKMMCNKMGKEYKIAALH